ncbi:hypothetical protein LCGC14_2662010, partial [marine sediment metagenome]
MRIPSRLHRIGLAVQRAGNVAVAQGVLGAVHLGAGAAQGIAGRVPLGGARSGQVARLTLKLIAQRLLAVGQRAAGLTLPLLALTLLILSRLVLPLLVPALLILARLTGLLTLLPLMRLAGSLVAVAALVLLAFTALGAGVVLLLKVAKGLVAEALLVAQRFLKPLHRLLTGALLALTLLTLGDLHIFHHPAKLIQKALRLVHA